MENIEKILQGLMTLKCVGCVWDGGKCHKNGGRCDGHCGHFVNTMMQIEDEISKITTTSK